MLESTCKQAIEIIASNTKVLILIENPGDPLSLRARQVLYSNQVKLQKLGYQLLKLPHTEELNKYEELLCARTPTLKVFRKHKLKGSYLGVPSQDLLDNIYKDVF